MKRNDHFRLSFFHIFGVTIIITGIFLMWCAYKGTDQKKSNMPENNSSAEGDEDMEEVMEYYSAIRSRAGAAQRISLVILGGLCILGGIPAFYVSRADTIYKLPKRSKYTKIQEPEEEEFDEFEFDYDNFDFDQYCFIEKDDDDNMFDSESSEFKSDADVINIIKSHYKKKDDNK